MPLLYKGLQGVKPREYDCEKKRCTARDFRGLAMAGRLYSAASGKLGEFVIKPRIQAIDGAWRCWKSGISLLGVGLDAAIQTVSDDQMERLNTIFEHGELDINLPRVSINEQGGSILAVHGAALERIVHHAMSNECGICIKEKHEVKRCDLYQALKGVIEPTSWDSSTCPYRDEIIRKLEEERGGK